MLKPGGRVDGRGGIEPGQVIDVTEVKEAAAIGMTDDLMIAGKKPAEAAKTRRGGGGFALRGGEIAVEMVGCRRRDRGDCGPLD